MKSCKICTFPEKCDCLCSTCSQSRDMQKSSTIRNYVNQFLDEIEALGCPIKRFYSDEEIKFLSHVLEEYSRKRYSAVQATQKYYLRFKDETTSH